jgi:transcriptional regulator of acetoin/glycerol metabolism
LLNVVEGAAALAAGPVIQLAELPESIRGRTVTVPTLHFAGGAEVPGIRPPVLPGHADLLVGGSDDEGARILAALRKHNNNRRRAAAELGISRVSLYKKLHKSGLFVPKQAFPSVV